MLGSSLIANFLLTTSGPRMGYHVLQKFTKETLESFPIQSLRIGRTRHVPDSSNHSLHNKMASLGCGAMWCVVYVMWCNVLYVRVHVV